MRRIAAIASAILLGMAVLTGCSSQALPENSEDQALTSSEYMAQVNQEVNQLEERLQAFTDAVSREDAVSMQTQAESAYAVLDDIASIEAPEELKDLQSKYVSASDKLKSALSDYVNLYLEIDNASSTSASNTYSNSRLNSPSGFDYRTYQDRVSAIQSLYDEAVSELEEADKTATEL